MCNLPYYQSKGQEIKEKRKYCCNRTKIIAEIELLQAKLYANCRQKWQNGRASGNKFSTFKAFENIQINLCPANNNKPNCGEFSIQKNPR